LLLAHVEHPDAAGAARRGVGHADAAVPVRAREDDRAVRRAVHPGAHGRARAAERAAAVGDRLAPGVAVPAGAVQARREVGPAGPLVREVVAAFHVAGMTTRGALDA